MAPSALISLIYKQHILLSTSQHPLVGTVLCAGSRILPCKCCSDSAWRRFRKTGHRVFTEWVAF